jgi:hypothetical protein
MHNPDPVPAGMALKADDVAALVALLKSLNEDYE